MTTRRTECVDAAGSRTFPRSACVDFLHGKLKTASKRTPPGSAASAGCISSHSQAFTPLAKPSAETAAVLMLPSGASSAYRAPPTARHRRPMMQRAGRSWPYRGARFANSKHLVAIHRRVTLSAMSMKMSACGRHLDRGCCIGIGRRRIGASQGFHLGAVTLCAMATSSAAWTGTASQSGIHQQDGGAHENALVGALALGPCDISSNNARITNENRINFGHDD